MSKNILTGWLSDHNGRQAYAPKTLFSQVLFSESSLDKNLTSFFTIDNTNNKFTIDVDNLNVDNLNVGNICSALVFNEMSLINEPSNNQDIVFPENAVDGQLCFVLESDI